MKKLKGLPPLFNPLLHRSVGRFIFSNIPQKKLGESYLSSSRNLTESELCWERQSLVSVNNSACISSPCILKTDVYRKFSSAFIGFRNIFDLLPMATIFFFSFILLCLMRFYPNNEYILVKTIWSPDTTYLLC